MRVFIAIDLPTSVRQHLRSVQARLRPQIEGVRWVDPDGAHLTLRFLGDTPDDAVAAIAAGLERATAGLQPFLLRTGRPGAFPSVRRPRVIWIGVEGDLAALRMTHAAVEREIAPLGFPTEDRPFSPHLTLGRVSRDAGPLQPDQPGRALDSTDGRQSVEFAVEGLTLVQSELSRSGARYTALARARLDG